MKAAFGAFALLAVAGVAAIVVWIFAADPAEAPPASLASPMTLSITSSTFEDGGSIPSRYTCDGENTNPPLRISSVPEGTKSLALIVDDPDVPKALKPDGVFDHWTLFNIDPATMDIGEGKSAGTPGANGAGKNAYTGPCPPPQYEPSEHRYFFRLLALDALLDLPEGSSKSEVLKATEGHIVAESTLMGKYRRKR